MSSELSVARSGSLASARERRRLHSRIVSSYTRLFSLMLLASAALLFRRWASDAQRVGVKELAVLAGVVAVAWFVWLRPTRVFATAFGLEVIRGKRLKLIPWQRVVDVCELPWPRTRRVYYAHNWRVRLDDDECFDFYGTLDAREVVSDYIERAERELARAQSAR